jgi:photosystem II stability/assembly factor-like uncharacterized protein
MTLRVHGKSFKPMKKSKSLNFVVSIYLIIISLSLSAQNQWANGPKGGYIKDMVEHKGMIFSMSNSKLFKSDNNAQTWQELDMSFLPFNASLFEFGVNENFLFVRASTGLFRSGDSGNTWSLIRNAVSRLGLHEATLFIYSSIDNKVYRSQNNGETWVQKHSPIIDNTPYYDIGKISFNGNVLFVGSVNAETALYRSGDLGETWEHITEGLIDPDLPQYYIGPVQALFTGSDILLATWLGVYKSTDNGLSWAPALYDEEYGCEKLMKSGDLIIAKGYGQKYWRSFDGAGWDEITNNFPNNVIHSILEQNNSKTIVSGWINDETFIFSGIDGIYLTNDSFNSVQETNNAGLVAWPVEPSQIVACDNYVYATAGARLFKTNDSGQSWSKIYEGFNLLKKSNNLIYGISGTSFDTYHFTTDFGATWQVIPNSTINWMAELNGSIYYTTQDGIYKSVDNGNTWVKKTDGIKAYNRIYATETTLFVNCMNPSDQGIHKSTDFGETWTNVGLGDAIYYGWEFINHNGVLFIGVDYTTPRGVWRSSDNGDTWVQVNSGAKVRRLESNGSKIYLSTYDPNSQKYPLFISTDNGATWTNIMDDSNNMFDADDTHLYVYSFPDHVVKSSNDGATWENISQGHFMFRPRINGINVLNQGLYAGTMRTGYYVLSLIESAATVNTLFADEITENSAILYGTVNANGSNCSVSFEYGLSTEYGYTVTAIPNNVTSNAPVSVMAAIEGLTSNTTYNFRTVASNTNGVYYGPNKTFTTTVVGLESVSVGKVKAYPNPFSDQVSITNTGELERLIVKNIFGQKVVEYDLNGRKYINTSAFPKGIYLFIFSDNAGNQRTHKMVKQ